MTKILTIIMTKKNIITSFYKIVNMSSLPAVLTFIGYKQTYRHTSLYIDYIIHINYFSYLKKKQYEKFP